MPTMADAPIEEIAHDDLCPVGANQPQRLLAVLTSVDLPIAVVHTGENTMQSPALRILHGTMGRRIVYEPDRALELRR